MLIILYITFWILIEFWGTRIATKIIYLSVIFPYQSFYFGDLFVDWHFHDGADRMVFTIAYLVVVIVIMM